MADRVLREKFCIYSTVEGEVNRLNFLDVDFNQLEHSRGLESFYYSLTEKTGCENIEWLVVVDEYRDVDERGDVSRIPVPQVAYVYYPNRSEAQKWVDGNLAGYWKQNLVIKDKLQLASMKIQPPPGVLWIKYSLSEDSAGYLHLRVYTHENVTLYHQSTPSSSFSQLMRDIDKLESERGISKGMRNEIVPRPEDFGNVFLTGMVTVRRREFDFENFGQVSRELFLSEFQYRAAVTALASGSPYVPDDIADLVVYMVHPFCKTPTYYGQRDDPNFALWDFVLEGQFPPSATPQELAEIWDNSPEIYADTMIGYSLYPVRSSPPDTPQYSFPLGEVIGKVNRNTLAVSGRDKCAWYALLDGVWKQFIQDERHADITYFDPRTTLSLRIDLVDHPWNKP